MKHFLIIWFPVLGGPGFRRRKKEAWTWYCSRGWYYVWVRKRENKTKTGTTNCMWIVFAFLLISRIQNRGFIFVFVLGAGVRKNGSEKSRKGSEENNWSARGRESPNKVDCTFTYSRKKESFNQVRGGEKEIWGLSAGQSSVEANENLIKFNFVKGLRFHFFIFYF